MVPEAEVLDESGRFRAFSEFTAGKVTLLGFVTTRCAEGDGCARVNASFRHIRGVLRIDRSLNKRVRFVSLALDPVNDVPRQLAAYAARTRGPARGAADWNFVTTMSLRRLAPILSGFGHHAPGTLVFLLDTRGVIRQVYSAEGLHALEVLADMRLLAEEDANRKSPNDDKQRNALAGS